jgi:hypothetical protein
MDRRGVLPAHRTSTGRRYWGRADLDKYLGRTTAVQVKKRYAYCRVSSSAQRPDLKKQRKVVEQFCVAKGLGDAESLEEIGGGFNFKRPKFLSMIDEIITGEVETLLIAHKIDPASSRNLKPPPVSRWRIHVMKQGVWMKKVPKCVLTLAHSSGSIGFANNSRQGFSMLPGES